MSSMSYNIRPRKMALDYIYSYGCSLLFFVLMYTVTCVVGIMIRVHYVREYNITAGACYYFSKIKEIYDFKFRNCCTEWTQLLSWTFCYYLYARLNFIGMVEIFLCPGKLYLFSEWWLSWWRAVIIWQAIYKSESFSNVIYSTLWFENYQVRFKPLPSFSSKRLIRITYISLSLPDTPSWVVTHDDISTNIWCHHGFQIHHQT